MGTSRPPTERLPGARYVSNAPRRAGEQHPDLRPVRPVRPRDAGREGDDGPDPTQPRAAEGDDHPVRGRHLRWGLAR